MANVSHASLTGTNLHEPKGVAVAAAGQAYIADGLGSGAWTNISATAFTGMIADFPTPVAPTGWLELDGATISSITFSALYALMTIQQNGSRGVGSPIITGLTSTVNMRPGYFVFGTGITAGSVINSVDSPTQITISINAASSGTSTVIVSPWLLNTNTIKLPDLSTAGRYRRSRSSTLNIGVVQADLVKNHTHRVTGTSGNNSADHTHGVNFTSQAMSANQTHHHQYGTAPQGGPSGGGSLISAGSSNDTTDANIDHTHAIIGTTAGISAPHAHGIDFSSGNPETGGGTETRPVSLILMTCIKT